VGVGPPWGAESIWWNMRQHKKPPIAATGKLVTRLQLAKHLKHLPRTISKWQEEGLPVARRGRGGRPSLYDEPAVRAWVEAREAAAQTQAPTFMISRSRKELAQALEAEQRVALRSGTLLAAADVDRTWSAEVAAVRARLLAIPTAWSDRLHRAGALGGAAGIEALLVEAIYQVLRELAGGASPTTPRTRRRPTRTRKA